MNKSVKTFNGLDHQYTPEENVHQFEAHMIFEMRKQNFDSVGYSQRPKKNA